MRIGIVNDMRLACEALRRVIQASPGLDVAWMAYNGEEAISQTACDRPDLVLMDLIMPVVDGAAATRRIMSQSPCPILVVTSSVTGNISKVYEALGHGAVDAVDTPVLGTGGQLTGAKPLLDKIATINKLYGPRISRSGVQPSATPSPSPSRAPAPPTSPPPSSRRAGPVLIGASTGGPTALKVILEDLPATLPAGLVIVQHVDEAFTPGLARWLDKHTRLAVDLAVAGDAPAPGKALLAHTNDHLAFTSDGRLFYTIEPAGEYYRPSVDVLFHSVLRSNLQPGVAVLLTGMGRDGAEGLAALRRAGWHTIAQDRATSVVYGMPKAAAELNAAVEVLPIQEIARAITRSLAPA